MKLLEELIETNNAFLSAFGPEFMSMYLFILALPVN